MPWKNVYGGGIQIHAYSKNKKNKKSKLKKYMHGGSHTTQPTLPGKEVSKKSYKGGNPKGMML